MKPVLKEIVAGRERGGPEVKCFVKMWKNASVHVTKIINGNKTELYLCESCAREKGETEISFEGKFPLHQFFSGLMGFFPTGGSETVVSKGYSGLQCPVCGLTYTQFGQVGRFGCFNVMKLLPKPASFSGACMVIKNILVKFR